MPQGLTIVAVPPNGAVTQLGTDRRSGVWVEDVSWDHSLPDKGARQCQFTMRREPEQEWDDLQPFTPLLIMKNGSVVWSGRVAQTPTIRGRENQITVIGEGWPMHLKDDAVEKWFVHDDLAAWSDHRRFSTVSLGATYTSAYDVVVGDGAATIACPLGKTGANLTRGAISLDLGPYNTCKRIVVTYSGGGSASNWALLCVGSDTPAGTDEVVTLDAAPIGAVASGVVATTFTTARRYVQLQMANGSGAGIAGADNAWVRIERAILFADTAYESGNLSVLKASQVLPVVLAYAPKVSQSTLGITTTSFTIPHFAGPVASPDDYVNAVNAYHGYQAFLRDGADSGAPSFVFRPVPSSPTIVANVGSGIEFNDASRNDGSEIYNRVIVEYTDAAGQTSREERTTAGLSTAIADPDIIFDTLSTLAAGPNPGFETAGGPPATGWSAFTGTITRDVVVFDTGAASGLISSSAGSAINLQYPITGLVPGRAYQLRYRVRNNAAWLAGTVIMTCGGGVDSFTNAIGAAFTTRTMTILANPAGIANLNIIAGGVTAAANIFYLDVLTLLEARPTIVDRQGFIRTKVLTTGSRLTQAAAQQIGDIYLQAHRFTPLRGSLTIQGDALRTLAGDVPIPAALIGGRYLGDAILINETDPDLGTIGRVGIINAASYDESTDTATVSIDTNRDFVDQLLARLSIFLPS